MMHGTADIHEVNRLAVAQKHLRDKLLFLMPDEGEYGSTLLCGFTTTRLEQKCRSAWSEPKPVMGLVVQGDRSLQTNGEKYQCGECCCFMDGLCATETSCIAQASPALPYLAISLELDSSILQGLMREKIFSILPQNFLQTPAVTKADIGIVDAFLRLINLVAEPEMFIYLAPFIVKEIHFRMIFGSFGEQIKHFHALQCYHIGTAHIC